MQNCFLMFLHITFSCNICKATKEFQLFQWSTHYTEDLCSFAIGLMSSQRFSLRFFFILLMCRIYDFDEFQQGISIEIVTFSNLITYLKMTLSNRIPFFRKTKRKKERKQQQQHQHEQHNVIQSNSEQPTRENISWFSCILATLFHPKSFISLIRAGLYLLSGIDVL